MNLSHPRRSIQRAIARQGQKAALLREGKNAFGEPTAPEALGALEGIFYTAGGYLPLERQEAGRIPENRQPRFLTLYRADVRLGDLLQLAGKCYRIAGAEDPGEVRLCLILSLEEDADV